MPSGRKVGSISRATRRIIEAVKEIVDPNNPTTVRFVLYKLVSNGTLSSTKEYEKLSSILRSAKIRGEIDDDAFLDNKRTAHTPNVWKSYEEFRENTKSWYHKDLWDNQDNRVLILVEKGTVGLVLKDVCREMQVPLYESAGYYSRPFLVKLADDIIANDKPTYIYYVGDHDPSGFDIERAAHWGNDIESGTESREGLLHVIANRGKDIEITHRVNWERLAITEDDFEGFSDVQKVDVKPEDPRAKAYVQQYGEYGAEVEALSQEVLQDRVRTAIESHLDLELWDESKRIEEQEKAQS